MSVTHLEARLLQQLAGNHGWLIERGPMPIKKSVPLSLPVPILPAQAERLCRHLFLAVGLRAEPYTENGAKGCSHILVHTRPRFERTGRQPATITVVKA